MNNIKVVVSKDYRDTKSKEEHISDYIESLVAIEEAMEPYKEQKRELRAEFKENGWLDTDEIRAAVKAYRLFKDKVDIEEVVENFNMFSGGSRDY